MASYTVSVLSGTTASSQFVLDGTAGTALSVWVRSHAALGWFIAFAPESGGPFSRLKRPDGSGQDVVVASGASGGVYTIFSKPSLYGRIEASAALASSSVAIVITEGRF